MRYDINVIFYLVDEFCKIYLIWQKHKLISSTNTRSILNQLQEVDSVYFKFFRHTGGAPLAGIPDIET